MLEVVYIVLQRGPQLAIFAKSEPERSLWRFLQASTVLLVGG